MSLGGDDAARLGVMIADASGHGVAAALMAAETRAYLRALALQSADVGSLATLTNRRLTPDAPAAWAFVTLFLASLEAATRTLIYTSAGHCPAYVLGADGSTRHVLESTGWPLAIDGSTVFHSSVPLVLQPGDMVFIYSDGLTEAMSATGEMFGFDRAIECVRAQRGASAELILSSLFAAVSRFLDGRPQADDITAVLIKVDGPPDGDGITAGSIVADTIGL
jgi:serine phosphatase RsbU (regulator of sigma subunit)